MFKRAVTAAIVAFGLFLGSLAYTYAGFKIIVPKKVAQGERIAIKVESEHSTAKSVKLSVTTHQGTEEYGIDLTNGAGTQEHTFSEAGSAILKVANSNDDKDFTTKILRVEIMPGGKR